MPEDKQDAVVAQPATDAKDHEKALLSMATPEFTNELIAYLKIRCPLVYITCNEEKRLLTYFKHLAAARDYRIYIWDCYLGLVDLTSDRKVKGITDKITDPEAALDKIIEQAESDEVNEKTLQKQGVAGNIYILLDFHRFLQDALPSTERRLKRFARMECMTSVIITGPHFQSTPAIENIFQVLDFPYPNTSEIINTLETLGGALKAKLPKLSKEIKDRQDELVNAVNGLTMVEAQNAFTKSIVIHRKFDIPTILNIKKQIIRRKGILEFYETDLTMADVGGLRNMVQWFERRKLAFHSNAKAYGLPAPKGVMAIGFPGTGKSLIAKAAASLYEMPLLRLDFGRLFNSLVGESERTARDAIKIAESLAPCILGSTVLDIGVDGSSRTIESLFDQFYKESKDIKTFEDGTIIAGNNSRLRSKTINLNNGQEMDTNLKSIIRRPAITRNLIKISTEDSHQITVTENHKILVEEDGKRIWKEAKDLKEGDDIITL